MDIQEETMRELGRAGFGEFDLLVTVNDKGIDPHLKKLLDETFSFLAASIVLASSMRSQGQEREDSLWAVTGEHYLQVVIGKLTEAKDAGLRLRGSPAFAEYAVELLRKLRANRKERSG